MKPERRLLAASVAMLFAAGVFASGGRVESLDLLDRIQPGVTTAQQVRELLGPPANTMHFPARGIDSLEYEAREYSDRLVISISIGSDGIVREVMRLRQSSCGAGM
jgi:outer membrane protein assembly factor BamE (lipoprotein component of BamABCDE complex)